MDYQVKISSFEGPLDLLLHLIKQSDIDIYDIKIDEITSQYLDYINKMQEIDLNIASEYLIMATELIEIKSRMLLPQPEIEEEDLRQNLIERLVEYQSYKEVVNDLKKLEQQRKEIFTKEPTNLNEYYVSDIKLDDNLNIDDLEKVLFQFLEKKQLDMPIPTKITKKEYLVSDRIKDIKQILKKKNKVEFTELFDINTKEYIIVTFLSMLSLAKKEEIEITQEYNFDHIFLSLRGE